MYKVTWRGPRINLNLDSPELVERFLDESLLISLASRDPALNRSG
jgi:hypothetical protein